MCSPSRNDVIDNEDDTVSFHDSSEDDTEESNPVE